MQEQELDAICAAWPGVTRSIKWEVDLVYSVANKMFAVMCTLGTERGRVSFKVDPDRFLELTDQPGIMPAPYMARAFWITVTEPHPMPLEHIARMLRRSYDLVVGKLPKKTQELLSAAPAKAAVKKTPAKETSSAKPGVLKIATKKAAAKPAATASTPKSAVAKTASARKLTQPR